jgi:hypothetical protein
LKAREMGRKEIGKRQLKRKKGGDGKVYESGR